ncbi:MAG TPA: class I SAM-dependent methyltransferase [bacterium (Candidatus Stahlbacteria)]|nr:class I SAM-dependent methyltransferase [Candidatus Stahlbacteria bacterium]
MSPFSEIAPYYDQLMTHVQYRTWVDYTKEIIRRAGIKGNRLIDLACGTGEPTRFLNRAGFDVVGLDSSQEMLNIAQQKMPDVRFIEADIRDFQIAERFDIAVSYYDSMNYLLKEEDLNDCFSSVYNILNEPGILIFDMNTIHVLKDHWDSRIVVRENGDLFSIWENGHDPSTNISTLKLTLFVKEGRGYLRFRELHKERGYENGEVLRLLNAVGFKEAVVYHHLTFNPPDDETDRVMFVVLK